MVYLSSYLLWHFFITLDINIHLHHDRSALGVDDVGADDVCADEVCAEDVCPVFWPVFAIWVSKPLRISRIACGCSVVEATFVFLGCTCAWVCGEGPINWNYTWHFIVLRQTHWNVHATRVGKKPFLGLVFRFCYVKNIFNLIFKRWKMQ